MLKAMLLAERAESERLRQIIKELQRHRFGRRAESLPEEQLDGSKNHWHFGVIADSVWLGDAGDRQWRDSRDFSTLTSG